MAIVWQGVLILLLFVALYLLHRRARKTNFERFRAHHSRRKYRIVAEPTASPNAPPNPTANDDSTPKTTPQRDG